MNVKNLVGVFSSATLWLANPGGMADTISAPDVTTNGNGNGNGNGRISSIVEPDILISPGLLGDEVGVSSRDGITYSAPDVLVTRNGVTRPLRRPLQLANGTRVMPNGSVILSGGGRMMIRPEQVLSFGGAIDTAPIAEFVPDTSDQVVELARRANSSFRARPASGATLRRDLTK